MKKVIIIHYYEGYPNYCWYPDTKKELEDKGYEVIVPEMPETNSPKFNAWLSELQRVASEPNENLYLIGHSLGCITILRYLEGLKEDEKIGGAILVAGFTDDLGFKEIKGFFETPIDFEKIKSHCSKFIAIHSDNDQYVPLKHGDIFKEKLGAKLIVKHNMGHFSGEIEKKRELYSITGCCTKFIRD
jgi:predicted alpha/beta hydrolase family esterase